MLPEAHLRVARATDRIDEVIHFYRDGLGFEVLSSFQDHAGFDGVMLGHRGAGYHLEFTHARDASAGSAPTKENLLVFYLPDREVWRAAAERMREAGYEPVPSANPYWDLHGVTFEDPDGYRVVLEKSPWTPWSAVPFSSASITRRTICCSSRSQSLR